MNTWRTLLKLKIQKKLNYKVSKNKHTIDEDKNNQIHSQTKIHNEYLKNINRIEKWKKLNMTEHKTDMNITKIGKQTHTHTHTHIHTHTHTHTQTEQHFYGGIQTDMNITEKLSSTFTKEH